MIRAYHTQEGGYSMPEMDEEILRSRQKIKAFEQERFSDETIENEKNQSILDGTILVNRIPISFAERTILEGRAAMWMPTDFEVLPQEIVEASYPYMDRPDVVYTNGYLGMATGYRHTSYEIPDTYMGEFMQIAKSALNNAGPNVTILTEHMRKTQKHTLTSLEMISHTITEAIYNILYFASLNDRVLFGFINFDFKLRKRYVSIAKEMLDSFYFTDEEVAKNNKKTGGKA